MISPTFLNEVATFADSKISKVVLNGTYEITNFSVKQVTDSTLSMQYLVPVGSVAEINQIELKSDLNNVVSSNTVYVPITSDTIISQIIKVRGVV